MNIDKKHKEREEERKRNVERAGVVHQHRQAENPEDDDRAWYRKEVGEDPDEGCFKKHFSKTVKTFLIEALS